MSAVKIYTDGACSGNPGPGGWGAVLSYNGQEKELYGFELETTNNRMELMAIIKSLEALKRKVDVIIYTDSKYALEGATKWMHNWQKNGWTKKGGLKNADLWQQLHEALKTHNVSWQWVKGHSGNEGNERADSLAVKGSEEAQLILKENKEKKVEQK